MQTFKFKLACVDSSGMFMRSVAPSAQLLSQYMRGLWVRKPLRKYWQGRPMSLFDEEAKAYFLAAGYAVATIDVRLPCFIVLITVQTTLLDSA